jgi:predicted nuclease with TOPRIM domain
MNPLDDVESCNEQNAYIAAIAHLQEENERVKEENKRVKQENAHLHKYLMRAGAQFDDMHQLLIDTRKLLYRGQS